VLDFPNAPTTGDTFTAPNGTAWHWDGTKWGSGTVMTIPDAPSDANTYGRHAGSWNAVLTGITSAQVTGALGFTPYNATNPANYQTSAQVTAALPAASSTPPLMDGTVAIGTGTTWARADHVHPSDTSRAPLASPTFTGVPAAPTAAPGANTTQLATTAFVATSFAPLASPTFTGTVTAPALTLSTTPLAVASGGTGAATAGAALTSLGAYAAANPAGYQTAAQVTAAVPLASSTPPLMDGAVAVGTGTTWARADHVHASDTSRAPLAGVTNGSNAAAGDVGEYISSQIGGGSPVAVTSGVVRNVTSIALTAGDWDIGGNVFFSPTATLSYSEVGLSSTSATLPDSSVTMTTGANGGAGFGLGAIAASYRANNSVPVTIYLVALASFASGTCGAAGLLWARRAR
jgi:hypothetical protein